MTDPKDPSLVPNGGFATVIGEDELPAAMAEFVATDKLLVVGGYHARIWKTPIRNLKIDDRTYRPQPDITPHELAMMLMLFATAGIGVNDWDFEGFIVEHGLERHWPKDEPPPYTGVSG